MPTQSCRHRSDRNYPCDDAYRSCQVVRTVGAAHVTRRPCVWWSGTKPLYCVVFAAEDPRRSAAPSFKAGESYGVELLVHAIGFVYFVKAKHLRSFRLPSFLSLTFCSVSTLRSTSGLKAEQPGNLGAGEETPRGIGRGKWPICRHQCTSLSFSLRTRRTRLVGTRTLMTAYETRDRLGSTRDVTRRRMTKLYRAIWRFCKSSWVYSTPCRMTVVRRR